MRKFFNTLISIAASLILSTQAIAADSSAQEAASSPIVHDAFKDKVLYVGCETAFAPFTYIDADGSLIGFDLDLIRAMAESEGFDVEVKPFPFDGLIPALMAGSIDLIISGFTISPERARRVDFSVPYYRCGLTFLIKKANADRFNTLEDLKDEVLCSQIGTTGALYTQKALPGTTLRQFNSPPESYLELQNDGCIAVINDRPVNDFFLTVSKSTEIVSKPITTDTSEYYGIAVRKGDDRMLSLINKSLKNVQTNGQFSQISNKWFGYDVSEGIRKE